MALGSKLDNAFIQSLFETECTPCNIVRCLGGGSYRAVRICMNCGRVVGRYLFEKGEEDYRALYPERVGQCPHGKLTQIVPSALCSCMCSESPTLGDYASADAEICQKLAKLTGERLRRRT